MTLMLNLPPELEERLRHEAARQGISSEDYALHVLKEKLLPTDEVFQTAAKYVLQKNAELYRRLA
jgi:plasmid stability protein